MSAAASRAAKAPPATATAPPPAPAPSPSTAVPSTEVLSSLTPAESAAVRAPFVPIVYGTVAFWLGVKKVLAPGVIPDSTHRWSVYVRHAGDGDLSFAVEKVVFILHPSVPEATRTITAPPYVVSECGWGEFEIGIYVHLRGGGPPCVFVHKLRLHPANQAAAQVDKPVVDEKYDELVVCGGGGVDPSLAGVVAGGAVKDAPEYPYQNFFGAFTPAEDLAKVAAARQWLADRRAELNDRLLAASKQGERVRETIRALGGT